MTSRQFRARNRRQSFNRDLKPLGHSSGHVTCLVACADGEGAVLRRGRGLTLHVALHHGRHAPLALHQRGH